MSSTPSAKGKNGTLRAAADGKLSFLDIAYLYSIPRPRIEGLVTTGREVMNAALPLLALENHDPDRKDRVGDAAVYTHAQPVSAVSGSKVTRVCVACESKIHHNDSNMVLAYLGTQEVSWCSRECAEELPIDAFLIASRYRRHWADASGGRLPLDERSRVRDVTPDRMSALYALAEEQGYKVYPPA